MISTYSLVHSGQRRFRERNFASTNFIIAFEEIHGFAIKVRDLPRLKKERQGCNWHSHTAQPKPQLHKILHLNLMDKYSSKKQALYS